MIRLELPFPPSLNHLWRHYRGRMVISARGQAYQRAVRLICAAEHVVPIHGEVAMIVMAHPPDRRKHDLDNLLKGTCDSLQRGGAYFDDSQITFLQIEKGPIHKGGKLVVQLSPRSESCPKS